MCSTFLIYSCVKHNFNVSINMGKSIIHKTSSVGKYKICKLNEDTYPSK